MLLRLAENWRLDKLQEQDEANNAIFRAFQSDSQSNFVIYMSYTVLTYIYTELWTDIIDPLTNCHFFNGRIKERFYLIKCYILSNYASVEKIQKCEQDNIVQVYQMKKHLW